MLISSDNLCQCFYLALRLGDSSFGVKLMHTFILHRHLATTKSTDMLRSGLVAVSLKSRFKNLLIFLMKVEEEEKGLRLMMIFYCTLKGLFMFFFWVSEED